MRVTLRQLSILTGMGLEHSSGTLVTLTSLLVRPELIEEVNRHVDIVGHALSEHLQTTRSGCGVTR